MYDKYKFYVFLILFPLFISCSGGGGGGGGTTSSTTEGVYLSEYNANGALAQMSIKVANDAGYTGQGVRVAVLDTGVAVSHSEFDSTTQTGRNFSGDTNALTDINGHGTHVASIIAAERDGSGMRGVAYDAEIHSYKIFNDSGVATGVDTDNEWSNVINYHQTDNIKVSNNSWGSRYTEMNEVNESIITATYPKTVASFQSAVSTGTIFVWSNGNNRLTQPSWQAGMPAHINNIESGWISVMAVDNNLQETLYTQRCGSAAAWCVAAPGGADAQATGGIYAADNDGGYIRYSGTSMAAPHVSGVLANVIERFPSLSSSRVRNRLLITASYSGLKDYYGNDATSLSTAQREAIFGQGMVNYAAATSVLGNLEYVIGDNYYHPNKSFDIKNNKPNLPNLIGHNDKIMNDSFTVFDSFDGANFSVQGSEIFNYSNHDNLLSTNPYYNDDTTLNFNNKSFMGLNFISNGGNNTNLVSKDFWREKLGFFSQSNTFIDRNLNNFNFKIYENDNLEISNFIQIQDQKSDSSFDGYGLRAINNFEKFSILTSFSESQIPIDFSLNGANISKSNQSNIELGFIYNLTDNLDFFYRDYFSKIDNISSSPFNFGLTDGEMSTKTLGMTYISKNKDFELGFGLFQPHILTNGEISFNKVSGRNPDGSIYYETVKYDANQNYDSMPMFLSANKKINQDIAIQISLQQSNYDPNTMGIGELKFIKKF